MDQKWIQILVILVFCQQMTSGAGEDRIVKEGEQVEIKCTPAIMGTMIVWFRVLDTSGMEFIASFSNTGVLKSSGSSYSSTFSHSKMNENVLIVKSFRRAQDSGVYSCASLYKGNELKFGEVIRLVGETVKATRAPAVVTIKQTPCTTATPCNCVIIQKPEETSPEMFCSPLILGPLAGGCGLLLLLLIIFTVYCNQMRTRRCPHHYKRKPRAAAPGKQMMTNRHV